MKIFVTGGTGFLGNALCDRLQAQGHQVVRPGRSEVDLRIEGSLNRFSGGDFDQIYHLAAWTQAGDFCLRHPGEQWLINQQLNTHVLQWWQQHQPQAKLIAIGTSCAYDPNLPLTEDNYLSGTPIDSLFTYAMTKRMLYAGLLALQKQFGMKYLHLVPSTLYGPGYHTDGRQMHFIFDLIRKILAAQIHGSEVVLWGDGHQCRELIYRDDFVDLAISLAQNLDDETINIGAGEEYSIRDFARLICQQVGYDFESIRFDTSRYVGARSKCLVTGKLRKAMPQFVPTSLSEGLRRTIEWFTTHRELLTP